MVVTNITVAHMVEAVVSVYSSKEVSLCFLCTEDRIACAVRHLTVHRGSAEIRLHATRLGGGRAASLPETMHTHVGLGSIAPLTAAVPS